MQAQAAAALQPPLKVSETMNDAGQDKWPTADIHDEQQQQEDSQTLNEIVCRELAGVTMPAVTGPALEAATATARGPVQLKYINTAQGLMLLGYTTFTPAMINAYSTKP